MLAWQELDTLEDPDAMRFPYDPAELVGAAAELVAMILSGRPAWHRDAACKEHPEVNFYPTLGEDIRPAKEVCSRCLVRNECLAAADGFGVWGGTSTRERKLARSAAA